MCVFIFFFKQKTAYEMRISDWSSDVCSSDLVVEIFGYVCPACANFQPLVSSWKSRLPSDVRFTYVPALFGGTWDDYARAFYAAESMGLVDRTHDAMYQAIHIERTLKGERGRDSVEDIAAFYGKFGVDPKQFASTMSSFAVNAKAGRAQQFAMRSQIGGTPSLVLDGKSLRTGTSYENMLQSAAELIAMERAAGQYPRAARRHAAAPTPQPAQRQQPHPPQH